MLKRFAVSSLTLKLFQFHNYFDKVNKIIFRFLIKFLEILAKSLFPYKIKISIINIPLAAQRYFSSDRMRSIKGLT